MGEKDQQWYSEFYRAKRAIQEIAIHNGNNSSGCKSPAIVYLSIHCFLEIAAFIENTLQEGRHGKRKTNEMVRLINQFVDGTITKKREHDLAHEYVKYRKRAAYQRMKVEAPA